MIIICVLAFEEETKKKSGKKDANKQKNIIMEQLEKHMCLN